MGGYSLPSLSILGSQVHLCSGEMASMTMGTWLPQPHQVDFSFFNMLALQTMGGMGWAGGVRTAFFAGCFSTHFAWCFAGDGCLMSGLVDVNFQGQLQAVVGLLCCRRCSRIGDGLTVSSVASATGLAGVHRLGRRSLHVLTLVTVLYLT
jgi:hypothetical protein